MKKRLASLLCVLLLAMSAVPAASALEGEASDGVAYQRYCALPSSRKRYLKPFMVFVVFAVFLPFDEK